MQGARRSPPGDPRPGMRRNKIISARDAARLVHDGDTVATGGFVGIGFPEELGFLSRVAFSTRDRRPA